MNKSILILSLFIWGITPVQAEQSCFQKISSYLNYLKSKFGEITELDRTNITATLLRISIIRKTENKKLIIVPLNQLKMIHPIDRPTSEGKLNQRIIVLKNIDRNIIANGVLNFSLYNQIMPSKNAIRVIKDTDGKFVIFDGNGRYEAIKRAFEDDLDLSVEVEYFETSSNQVTNLLHKLRRQRGFHD